MSGNAEAVRAGAAKSIKVAAAVTLVRRFMIFGLLGFAVAIDGNHLRLNRLGTTDRRTVIPNFDAAERQDGYSHPIR
jgi:hypothetical protein